MIEWMTGTLLTAAGALVAPFLARDNTNFGVFQMMTATLILAFSVCACILAPALWRAWRGAGQSRD